MPSYQQLHCLSFLKMLAGINIHTYIHTYIPRRPLTEAVSVNGPEFLTVSDYLAKFGLNQAFRSASRAPKSGLMIQDHGSGPREKKPEARGGGGKKSRSRKKKVMGKKAPNFLTRVPSNGMVGFLKAFFSSSNA